MPPSQVTVQDAAAFLAGYFADEVTGVEQVGEGAWSRAFGFVLGGGDHVIRFGSYPEDFAKDRWAARWGSPRLPVPEVTEMGVALGAHYAITARARGQYLENLDAGGWARALPAVLAALDAMREADLGDTRGFGGWEGDHGNAARASWPEFLLAVAEDPVGMRGAGWPGRLAEMSPAAERLFARSMTELSAAADDVPRRLVHGDLINRNVLVAGDRLAAVFDWGCSLYGDHLYDAAWLEFWAPWHPGLAAADVAVAVRRHHDAVGLDVPGRESRRRACLIHIGLGHLAYNASIGDGRALAETADRLAGLL